MVQKKNTHADTTIVFYIKQNILICKNDWPRLIIGFVLTGFAESEIITIE